MNTRLNEQLLQIIQIKFLKTKIKNPQSPQEKMAANLIHAFLNCYVEQASQSPANDESVQIAKAIQKHNNDLNTIAQ